MFDPVARWSLLLTAWLSGISVAIEFVLGLLVALTMVRSFPGRGVIMSILIVPLFISPVIVGQAWTLLLQRPFGPTNYILTQLLGQEVTIGWMTESPWLYVSLIIADVWQWTPFMFVILLAGLTAIPPNLYEAAELDGVNAWQAFWAITLPHLAPMMLLALTFRLLDAITHVRYYFHHDRRRARHADLHRFLLSLHRRLHPVPSVAGDRRKLVVPDLHRARGHAAGATAFEDGAGLMAAVAARPSPERRSIPVGRILLLGFFLVFVLWPLYWMFNHLDQAERRLSRRAAGLVPRPHPPSSTMKLRCSPIAASTG